MNIKSNKTIKTFAAVLFAISMIFLFSVSVSAVIKAEINYEEEIIVLTGGTGDGVVKYMYSPNVDSTLNAKSYTAKPADAKKLAKKLAAEKWYPVYGDTININSIIPRADGITLAFRDADEFPNEDGVYESREVSPIIPCRPENINQSFLKTYVKYNPATETIDILAPELQNNFDYKVGIGVWQKGTGTTIDVSSKYNALGGTVVIRKSATSSYFASIEYKIKIPKAPAMPKLKINNDKIIGISTKDHKWSITEDGDFDNIFTYKAIDINDINDTLKIEIGENQDYIDIYVKTPAKDKKPSSPVQRLRIENPKKNKTNQGNS